MFVAQGVTGAGDPLSSTTVAYTASLSKQITAACAAVLVREEGLDMEATLAHWLPELPAWAGSVRLRHLVYHTASLPDHKVDAIVGSNADRTTPAVLSALAQIPDLGSRPGTTYRLFGCRVHLLGHRGGAGSRTAAAHIRRKPDLYHSGYEQHPLLAGARTIRRRRPWRTASRSAVPGRWRGLVDRQ